MDSDYSKSESEEVKDKNTNEDTPLKKNQAHYRKDSREMKKAANSDKLQEEIKTKKSRSEYMKEYRARKKQESSKDPTEEIKTKKTQAQCQKDYRERLKSEEKSTSSTNSKLRVQKHREKISSKELSLMNEEYISQKQKKAKTSQDNNISDNCTQRSIMPLLDTLDNSFVAPYEQSHECAIPNDILSRDTNIPGDGNCFFHSVIRVMRLDISPKNLRQRLLNSVHLQACTDPSTAIAILQTHYEYADYNCLFIFSREYDQNICVHFHYFNININKYEIAFCHYKVNDTRNFIHLHLLDKHFTPYIEVQQMNIGNRNDVEQMNDILAENGCQDDIDYEDQDDDDMLSENERDDNDAMEIDGTVPIYTNYYKHSKGHLEFDRIFKKNTFGHSCGICDRLWWKNDLKKTTEKHANILEIILPGYVRGVEVDVCSTCKKSLDKQKIPILSVYNGFSYPVIPSHLPNLNLIEQRLISPRIPFMQIRRLRHVHGQYGIYGQIINVPVEVNTMVKQLPRNVNDDHCLYVHIKKKLTHKTSYVHGLINQRNIKEWLTYLVKQPLYQHYGITIDNEFLNNNSAAKQLIDEVVDELVMDDVSEHVPIDENVTAQQQTLLWNEDKFLHMAPGERSAPISLLFDEHAEELSFPTIYGGHFRNYKEGIHATPFTQATSEIRRTDRRATDPQHLLYMAAKVMRHRVSQSINVAFKHVGKDTKITKEKVQSEEFINNCIESNLAFLRSIPNSAWYWADRKKDLFSMIRQLGAPTAFMTLSANETGWEDLLKILYKLKNNQELTDEFLTAMNYVEKAKLVNEDAVTCAIYFNKLVNCILKILQSKTKSPFGKYRVVNYFKRIEFQHRGSPHAHILLWLDNAPKDLLNNNEEVIKMIDELVSVSELEASENIKLLTHKHTFTCYKKMDPNKKDNCRFGAPFMPTKKTITLFPMKNTDSDYSEENFKRYKELYNLIRTNLENNDYSDFEQFYTKNNIESDEHYYNIIRAGIKRPKLFYRRTPAQKWYNPFNPFVFHLLKSNMDFQIIQDEYACAAYVVEYVNKHNRGISNLQRQIFQIMEENPEFDIVDITKKMSVDVLHAVEMPAQEAAWYLLREPMAKSSVVTVYIPTIHPSERQRMRKTLKELDELNDDCTDIWKKNWFDKYEKRPEDLNDVTLAQYVANYYINNKGIHTKRKEPKVIRYRNYEIADNFNDYRREMVLLHIPFRSEDNDVLAENKYIQIYEDNKELILERRKEFESNLDIEKTLQICKELCREEDTDDDEVLKQLANVMFEEDPYAQMQNNPHSTINADIQNAMLGKIGAIAKKRENLMDRDQFIELMRLANEQQKNLLMNIISHLLNPGEEPFQIFFTGPAGSGKTFVIKLIMEIYNRFSDTDGYCNAYVACASTGKAAVAIDGTTVHTALKIAISKLLPLSAEMLHLYRTLFTYVKVLIIDEISMISAELLSKIDLRLKQITANHTAAFGNLDIILIGDLRQAPPVRGTPIYQPIKANLAGSFLWRTLQFYELTQVMRQANVIFSTILTKIGNGNPLEQFEFDLIESRFFKKSEAERLCPNGIRLFFQNKDVNAYNNYILQQFEDKITSVATDVISGAKSPQQEATCRTKLHKLSVGDSGGLPYEITFVINKYYIITTNIDVSDGLCNGTVGKLVHLDFDEKNNACRVWLEICGSEKIGQKKRKKSGNLRVQSNVSNLAVPIELRTANIPLTTDKKVVAKRRHFPLTAACAMTIHKSQGGTYDEIVYEYSKSHSQELVYVALSRVTSIDGLYIVTRDDDEKKFKFYHNRVQAQSTEKLLKEFERLSLNPLQTKAKTLLDFINNKKGISTLTLNVQSLRTHSFDLNDSVTQKTNVLLLSETNMHSDQIIDIPNFNCIVHYKRSNVRSGGVAIYHNNEDKANIITPNMNVIIRNTNNYRFEHSSVGDICSAICKMENDVEVVMVVVYIAVDQKISDIKEFIFRALVEYSKEGSQLFKEFGKNYEKLPLILAGDFNVNFKEKKSEPLKEFLYDKFDLRMNNDPAQSTTRYHTTIDAVFARYLENMQSQTYISYFSYHRPIISMIEYSD